ncbi:MAG TPA: TonB-dependent receptor [Candidatus Eisenbacteria bacterium]
MGKRLEACGFLLAVLVGLTPRAAVAQTAEAPPAAARPTGTVRGRVLDSQSREPIGLAEVVVVRTGPRAFSEDDGRFVLEHIPAGACTLSVTRLGYAPLRRELTVAEGQETALELQLTRNAVRLEEITVTPGSFSFMGQGTGVRQTMSREDVQAVPQIGDDIFRAVNRLPGLASNDYAAHFGIRGGRHDETLILLDGLELYEPYHLKDFNEGAISIIDAETIDGVQLMTGGFPARYGNKRSGVFDITSRTPESEHTRLDLGTSFMNTRGMGSGSFAGDKGSWLGFGRVGYMGPVFQFIDQADLPKPDYADGFGKLSYRLSPRNELALEILHGGDRYVYDIAATTGFLDTINTREVASTHYNNSYVWTTLKSTLSPRTTVRTLLSGGLVKHEREGSERDVRKPAPFYHLKNDRTFTTVGLVQDWTHGFSDRNLLGVGVDFRAQHNEDSYETNVYQDPDDPEAPDPGEFPINTKSHIEKSGSRLAAYLSDRWRVVTPLVLEVGVRYDHATWTGDDDVSPRASAAFDLGRGMTARVGWGHYRQMQGIDDVASLNNSTTYYPSELSEQWTAAWDRVGAKGSLIRIEAYWKRGSNLRPVFRNWKGAVDAFPEPNEDRIEVFPDRNTARGVEVYFDRPIGEHLTARASYSYSIADEDVKQIVNVNSPKELLTFDKSHPNPQDQRNAANADLTWRVRRWTLNGSFAYHSGWPSTLEHFVPVLNDLGQPDVAIRPEKIYGDRLPDYLRLDARLTRKWLTGWGDFGASLEVINVTNNANVFGYDYFRFSDNGGPIRLERGDETWFSIFPSLGVTWSKSF